MSQLSGPKSPGGSTAALELRGVDAGYGRTAVLRGVNISVPAGSVVALLGANGAGKTTTLKVAAGLLRPRHGEVLSATKAIQRKPPHYRARMGLCLIPEGRGVFRSLTVKENLELQIPPWQNDKSIQPAIDAFPILGARLGQVAASLSGGEQQMLALSRAFLAKPKVVLLDEVSMGLAPLAVDEIFAALEGLAASGVALLVVEQYVHRALELADVAYLMVRGEIVWSGATSEMTDAQVATAYLGDSPEDK